MSPDSWKTTSSRSMLMILLLWRKWRFAYPHGFSRCILHQMLLSLRCGRMFTFQLNAKSIRHQKCNLSDSLLHQTLRRPCSFQVEVPRVKKNQANHEEPLPSGLEEYTEFDSDAQGSEEPLFSSFLSWFLFFRFIVVIIYIWCKIKYLLLKKIWSYYSDHQFILGHYFYCDYVYFIRICYSSKQMKIPSDVLDKCLAN